MNSNIERVMYMNNIIACDDDLDIVNAIKIYLTAEGFNVIPASNGREACDLIKGGNIDLLLMDVMMPEMNGIEATMAIREAGFEVPVILITAKGEYYDKVLGLNAGADDYITKPFNPIELVARVKSQLRRYIVFGNESKSVRDDSLKNGGIVIDDNAKTVSLDGSFIDLTPTEFSILKVFVENVGTVLSPKEIYKKVWNEEPYGNEGTVLVHIRHLRQKIEIDPANPRYIVSVFGHGYKMERMS